MSAANAHVTAEAAAFVERCLGARPGAMDRFSGRDLELLFDVVTSSAGALLHLSFIEIGTAADTSPGLLVRTFAQCLEWEDVWLTSSALDHPSVDDTVVEAAVDSFLRTIPAELARTEEFSVSIVVRRLCETSRLTTHQIDRLAQHSLHVAEQLTHALAEWRAAESALLARQLDDEPLDEPKDDGVWIEVVETPLAMSLSRFIEHRDESSWKAALGELATTIIDAPLSARVGLERLHRSGAVEAEHARAMWSSSTGLSAMWHQVVERHHRLELAHGVIGLDTEIQPAVVAILDREPMLSLHEAVQRVRTEDESVPAHPG